MSHQWPLASCGSCSLCGLFRMKRGGAFAYSINGPRGPWDRTLAVCDPGAADERRKHVRTIDEPSEPTPMLMQPQSTAIFDPGWRSRPIVMIDVETTGLDWTIDDVVEIGVAVGRLEYVEGELPERRWKLSIEKTYQSLVRPERLFARPERCSAEEREQIYGMMFELSKISYDDLAGAPPAHHVASELTRFLHDYDDGILATYNATFDVPFINGSLFRGTNMLRPGILSPQRLVLDPYVWVQKFDQYVKGTGRHKLMNVAARYGILDPEAGDAERAHRADFDAEVALKVLAQLCDRVPSDLEELSDWQRAARAEWEVGFFGNYRPRMRAQERAGAA